MCVLTSNLSVRASVIALRYRLAYSMLVLEMQSNQAQANLQMVIAHQHYLCSNLEAKQLLAPFGG